MPQIPAEQLAKLAALKPQLPKVAGAVKQALKQITGDVWSWFQKPNTWVVVPTSADKQMVGQVARQAQAKVPGLAKVYAAQPEPFLLATKSRLALVPTKATARDKQASLEVIESSLQRLRQAIDSGQIKGQVALPQLGTGSGKLKWEAVEPLVEKHLAGVDYTIVKPAENLKQIYPDSFGLHVPGVKLTEVSPAPPAESPIKPTVPATIVERAKKSPAPKAKIAPQPLKFGDPDDIALSRGFEMDNRARQVREIAGPQGESMGTVLSQGAVRRVDKVIGTKASKIKESIDTFIDDASERSFLTEDEVEGLTGRRIFPISGAEDIVERVPSGPFAFIKEGFKFIHPQRLARTLDPTGRLSELYDRGVQFINRKARTIKVYEDRVAGIVKPLNSDDISQLVQALDGKLDASRLSPQVREAHRGVRGVLDELARKLGLRARVGDEITLDLTGKAERYLVVGEDEAARTVTLKGLTGTYTPGARARSTQTFTINMDEAYPRYLHDYFPHMLKGDWWVVNPALQGTGQYKMPFSTWDDAQAFLKQHYNEAQIKGAGIYVEPKVFVPDEARVALSRNALGAIKQAIKEDVEVRLRQVPGMPGDLKISGDLLWDAITKNVRISPSLRTFNNLMPRRLNLEAYERDFYKVMQSYIRGAVSKAEGDVWRKEAFAYLNGDPFQKIEGYRKWALAPETIRVHGYRPMQGYKWFADWAAAIDVSRPSALERWADDIIFEMGGRHSWAYRRAIHNMGQVMSILKLSSPISALVNLTQTALITWPVLGKHTTVGLKALGRLIEGDPVGAYGIPIKKILKDLDAYLFVSRSALDHMKPGKVSELFLYFFNSAEKVNRAVAGLGGFYKAMEQNPAALRGVLVKGGMPAEQVAALDHYGLAIEWSKRWAIDYTQFRYGIEAGSAMMRDPTVRLLLQFKTYIMNYLNFAVSLFEKERPGRLPSDTRAAELTRFVVATVGGAGILGLPFVETIDREIYRRTGWSWIDEVKKIAPDKVFNVSMRGVGALLDVDLSGRIGISADFETGVRALLYPDRFSVAQLQHLSPITGALGDLRGAIAALQTNRDEPSVDRLLQVLAPVQMWYLYYAIKQTTGKKLIGPGPSGYVEPGGVYSPYKGGAKITEYPVETLREKIDFFGKKAVGLRGVKEAEASDLYLKQEAIEASDKGLRESYRRRIVQAWHAGRLDQARALLQEAKSRGIDMSRLREEARQQQRTLLERQYRRTSKPRRREAIEKIRKVEPEFGR